MPDLALEARHAADAVVPRAGLIGLNARLQQRAAIPERGRQIGLVRRRAELHRDVHAAVRIRAGLLRRECEGSLARFAHRDRGTHCLRPQRRNPGRPQGQQ